VQKTYINSILSIIIMVFIVIESGFTFTVIRVHQFSPVQVVAMKQILALSPSQVQALCILALIPLESYARYSVDSTV
jgi:hypothetical protein